MNKYMEGGSRSGRRRGGEAQGEEDGLQGTCRRPPRRTNRTEPNRAMFFRASIKAPRRRRALSGASRMRRGDYAMPQRLNAGARSARVGTRSTARPRRATSAHSEAPFLFFYRVARVGPRANKKRARRDVARSHRRGAGGFSRYFLALADLDASYTLSREELVSRCNFYACDIDLRDRRRSKARGAFSISREFATNAARRRPTDTSFLRTPPAGG